jgi:hypothetical protein
MAADPTDNRVILDASHSGLLPFTPRPHNYSSLFRCKGGIFKDENILFLVL